MNGYEKALEDIKQIPVLTAEMGTLEHKIAIIEEEISALEKRRRLLDKKQTVLFIKLEELKKIEAQVRMEEFNR